MSRSVTDRRAEIVRLVSEGASWRLAELSEELDVSAVTVRRDVEHLAAEGRVRRTHGSVTGVTGHEASEARSQLTIGMVAPHAEYYFGTVVHGARAAAVDHGARLTLGVSAYDSELEMRLASRLVDRGVDGLLLAPTPDYATGVVSDEVQEWLASIRVPVVLVERQMSAGGRGAELDRVVSAHDVGCASAVRHLADLGHTRLAFIAIDGPNTVPIRTGYLDGIRATGVRSLGEITERPGDTAESVRALLALVEQGATAVVVHNDQLAMRLLAHFDGAGVRVPDDLSLVCYDDISAELAQPALTAVAPQKAEIGRRAFRLIAERIAARATGAASIGAEHVALVPTLRVRNSTRVWRAEP
ncbi:substrate-binding domain-containing protein [Agromyces sp. PvR057]|uniref:substrate-binding domain-containing protein n=1 Tax=Agromyces sp. PvR057 TaxID=3156403 RepID=UPI00339608E4